MKTGVSWETVQSERVGEYQQSYTERMKVPGGWLYRHTEYEIQYGDYGNESWEKVRAVAMSFVPDPSVKFK